MPTYRYFTTDALTGEVQGELPLYGTYMDKQIKKGGNFTGTFRLGTGIDDDSELLNASTPNKCCIYCQRDGTTIWGGLLRSRTFESNAKTVQLSGISFEGYLGLVTIKSNYVATNKGQLTIVKELIDMMQSAPRANMDINTGVALGGITRNIAIPFYENRTFGEAISLFADAENGFDWYISVNDGPIADQPILTLVLGEPIIAPNDPNNLDSYEYPGSIDQFYWPESGSKSGTDFILQGLGSGSNMIQAYATWPGSELYPEIDQIVSRKDIANQDALNEIARSTALAMGSAVSNPTISLKSDADPGFDGWNGLGSYYQFNLESPRFADSGGSKETIQRMLGWQLTPAADGQSEMVKLILDGEDDNA